MQLYSWLCSHLCFDCQQKTSLTVKPRSRYRFRGSWLSKIILLMVSVCSLSGNSILAQAAPDDSHISYPVIPLDPTQPKPGPAPRSDPHLAPSVILPGGLLGLLPIDSFIFRLIKVGQTVQWTAEQTYKNTTTNALDEFLTDFAPRDYSAPPPDQQTRKNIRATSLILQKTVEYCFTHGLPQGPQGYVDYQGQKKPPVEEYTQLKSIIEHRFPHIIPPDMSVNLIHYVEYAMFDACLKAAKIKTDQVLQPGHNSK